MKGRTDNATHDARAGLYETEHDARAGFYETERSPRQVIRDFAEKAGICTRCTCKWAINGHVLCGRCHAYTLKAKKSLARVILRENGL